MGHGQNLTQEQKLAIKLLRKQGYSVMDIVAISGRSKSTVKRVLKDAA